MLHFIRTRFQWYHTHSNSRAISLASKAVLYKGLSLCLSSHQCLLMMHAAHIFNTDTLHSLSFTRILKSWTSDSIFFSSRTVSLPFCLLWCLFGCWVLFVYCFQMADTDFICVAFKFPESFLQPWLKRLSCFLSPVFMMGPFKCSNWKQLSLPVFVLSRGKCLSLCAAHHLCLLYWQGSLHQDDDDVSFTISWTLHGFMLVVPYFS